MTERNIFIAIAAFVASLSMIVLLNSSSSAGKDSLVSIMEKEYTPTKLEELDSKLTGVASAVPADMTIILTDLGTGETLEIGNDRDYIAASLYKLFIAYYSYWQIDEGNITLDTVLSNDRTLDSCLNLMITNSDNECGILLGNLFGWANVEAKIQADGFTSTSLNSRNSPNGDIITSPDDISKYFKELYSGDLLTQAHTEHLVNMLLNQKINDRLPPIIPDGYEIAHKTGDVYQYIHDAGIIYTENGDYAFVIMSADWDDAMTFGPGYVYFQEIFSIIFGVL